MSLKIAIFFLLGTPLFSNAGEKEISRFNGEKESIERMSAIIRQAAREGSTVVRFPDGQWIWHDLTRLELPPKRELLRKEFDATSADLDESIRKWITERNIKAVQIAIDKESPARLFFKVENLLTGMGMPYALVGGAEVDPDRIILHEADGGVRSLPPKELKGEDGADQPGTAPESKLEGKEKPKPNSEVRLQ